VQDRCNARRCLSGVRATSRARSSGLGSGVDWRQPFDIAAIGDRAGSGARLQVERPSGNAALSETMTSTAPHLSVRSVAAGGSLGRPVADRWMQRGTRRALSIRRDRRSMIRSVPLGTNRTPLGMEVLHP
jgi:hypothetical protein